MTDSKESIRIGSPPVPGDSPTVLVVSPKKRLRWELPITVAAVGVLLILGVSAVGLLKSHNKTPAAPPAASAPAVASAPAMMSEATACASIVPLATDGARELTAVLNDPSRDTTALAAITAELRAMEPTAPDALRSDLITVDTVFQRVTDAYGDRGRIAAAIGDSTTWSQAGLRIAARCRAYAH